MRRAGVRRERWRTDAPASLHARAAGHARKRVRRMAPARFVAPSGGPARGVETGSINTRMTPPTRARPAAPCTGVYDGGESNATRLHEPQHRDATWASTSVAEARIVSSRCDLAHRISGGARSHLHRAGVASCRAPQHDSPHRRCRDGAITAARGSFGNPRPEWSSIASHGAALERRCTGPQGPRSGTTRHLGATKRSAWPLVRFLRTSRRPSKGLGAC